MSYEAERRAITNWMEAHNFWDVAPFGVDGGPVTLAAGAGFMALLPGIAQQRSTGAPGANLHDTVGVLAITLLTEGGLGSGPGREKADEIIADLTGLKLDEAGFSPSASSVLTIDFARNGLAPYIASSVAEAPFHRTVINAPFVRTERK